MRYNLNLDNSGLIHRLEYSGFNGAHDRLCGAESHSSIEFRAYVEAQ